MLNISIDSEMKEMLAFCVAQSKISTKIKAGSLIIKAGFCHWVYKSIKKI
jgi:hypothetical protein